MITVVQRLVLRTSRGPLRGFWAFIYGAVLFVYLAYLGRGRRDFTAYLRGSFAARDQVYGLSDLDIAIVLPDDAAAPGSNRRLFQGRSAGLLTLLKPFRVLVDWPGFHEEADLRDAAGQSVLTYNLDGFQRADRDRGSVYHGRSSHDDQVRLLERPELNRLTHGWRLAVGRDRRPAPLAVTAAERRIAAWLELQFWWRQAIQGCVAPGRPGAAHLCVKLVAEPARIWLWLTEGKCPKGRRQALQAARGLMPEEAGSMDLALELLSNLQHDPRPPLAAALAALVRLSAGISVVLADQVEECGVTEVRLTSDQQAGYSLPHRDGGHSDRASTARHPLLPLADWRALAFPTLPDETFYLVDGAASDPSVVAEVAAIADRGAYPSLYMSGLLVRPCLGGRSRLRTVQCQATDPASFALLDGRGSARYPNVPGWSALDTAKRAVAEYRAWLRGGPNLAPGPSVEASAEVLGSLMQAARAALFLESLAAGYPELPLTIASTMFVLSDRMPASRGVAEDALASYRDFVQRWTAPSAAVISALHRVVRDLEAFREAS